jgi:DNA polymerase elongation subunit (family B)
MRDSSAILPIALADYKKDDLDYHKLEAKVRNKNKPEILKYLQSDCVNLYELVSGFIKEFGPRLTIGSAAMQELQEYHEFDVLDKTQDTFARAYYYGGRVQCFAKGVNIGRYKVYDVNSMYPSVMKNLLHPIGNEIEMHGGPVNNNTCFVGAYGKNHGAFPKRDENGSLRFDIKEGYFSVSIHEWRKALQLKMFEPFEVKECVDIKRRTTFAAFVDHFFELRGIAKANKDRAHDIFYKLILNSAYGKFAQDPSKYREYVITANSADVNPGPDWEPIFLDDTKDGYIIWERPVTFKKLFNTYTAASITGAARSVLMDAISKSTNPMYCDTDSIICDQLSGVTLSDTELGAWKYEGEGTRLAIAGKKMYALFDGEGNCIKEASKGAQITPEEIVKVAAGECILWRSEAPTLGIRGSKFLVREIKRT